MPPQLVVRPLSLGTVHHASEATGSATAVGALIPVFPFLVLHGAAAIWVSFTLAMGSHFLVGGARSVFTGRGLIRSGIDMFVVGLGVAVAGYYVGEWVAKAFA